jgi:SAM-dependent methyltransferase
MPPLDESVPVRFRPALDACATGAVPANIGLLRLLIEATSPEEAGAALRIEIERTEDHHGRANLEAAERLLIENPQAFSLVKTVLRDVEHRGAAPGLENGIERWADTFDHMARATPEGAVALYAFGNPELLRAATGEVVAYLRDGALLGPRIRVLDIGCGIGRFVEALAPEVAEVTGLDISRTMIEEARRRCRGLANVRLQVSSGRDLAPIRDASIDLALAADVFPYLLQAGPFLVEAHIREARRILAPGGSLVILNVSYRDDAARDAEDVRRLAFRYGLTLATAGTRPFSLWDASVFRLAKGAEPDLTGCRNGQGC